MTVPRGTGSGQGHSGRTVNRPCSCSLTGPYHNVFWGVFMFSYSSPSPSLPLSPLPQKSFRFWCDQKRNDIPVCPCSGQTALPQKSFRVWVDPKAKRHSARSRWTFRFWVDPKAKRHSAPTPARGTGICPLSPRPRATRAPRSLPSLPQRSQRRAVLSAVALTAHH